MQKIKMRTLRIYEDNVNQTYILAQINNYQWSGVNEINWQKFVCKK